MSSDRFQQVQRLFHQARRLDADTRTAMLDKACAGNAALREEVESLLEIDADSAPGFMGEPILGDGLRTPAGSQLMAGPEAAAPETIGQYRILSRLGEGGMGVVYKAEQEKTASIVALKVIRPGLATPELLRRFEQEAQVLGRLRHAGIAQVYEAGIHTADGASVAFIAMELIDGPSLLEYVKRESSDSRTILKLFAMICDAVQHAHQKGVIHRDLKPGNILVEHTDQSLQPKILDFGIARVTDADTLVTTLQTRTGQLLGTIKYMSPEQAAGDPTDIDTRSDVYALGVILYELLARRMPYEVDCKMIHEAVRVIREDDAKPLSSVSRNYRGDLTTILGKTLEKDKARRYQSASELATDIRRYLNDEPITAHPPSAMYQLQKFASRNRSLVAGVALLFVFLLSGIIVTTWQAAVAANARDEAQSARQAEQHQRERAERRLVEVRELAHSLIFEFDRRIRWLAGSTPAREFLVKKALKYLDSLAEDIDPDDIGLQAELGAAYCQLGDVQGDPRVPNLGDPEGALRSYMTGLPFVKAVAAATPHNKGPQRSVGNAYNRIGVLLVSMGRQAEAGEYHQRAMRHFERLSAAYPDDSHIRRELGQCYQIQSDSLEQARRFEAARTAALKALAMFKIVIEQEPDNVRTKHSMAAINSQLGGILDTLGKSVDALAYRRRCLTILESLAKADPHHAAFKRSLGNAAERVGFAYQQSGDLEKALPYCHKAAAIAEELITTDPNFATAQRNLVVAYIRVGEVQLALKRTDEARKTFRRNLELCQEYAEGRENNAGVQRQLGVAFYKLAELETARAKDESLDAAQRREHWRNAGGWLQKCHAAFIGMRDRKILPASDRGVPDEIAAEITACDDQLAGLAHNDR